MRVCEELDFNDLMNRCWAGAVDTLNTIYDNDKEDEFMGLLEEEFFSEVPTLTAINDLLWFDSDWVFEMLGISEEEEEEEEDDDDDDDDFDEWENNPRMDEEHDGDRFDFPERF